MRKTLWLLLLASAAVGLNGCPVADDDDATEPVVYPFIVEANPSAAGDETNFFYQADLRVEFDRPPETATIVLKDAGGAELGGTQTADNPGRTFTFDPTADLVPDSSYTVEVAWTPKETAGPATIPFQTGPHGTEIGAGAADMIGVVYNIDLANATFVEPPGVGPIIGSQLDGMAILFTPTDESDFGAGTLHILGAMGAEEGGNIVQEPCAQTLPFTYGPNGVFDGGGDDQPASFIDPVMQIGPTDLTITIQGISATIQDLFIGGTFNPDLSDMRGGTFAGSIDTRPLAPELDPDGGESAVCDLVWETVQVACEECGEPNPGAFCLSVLAEDIVATEVPGLVLQPLTCVDIIDLALNPVDPQNPVCAADEAAEYDEDGDGAYELCPDYVAGTR